MGSCGFYEPERYGPWATVYSRFRRWKEAGIRERVLSELQAAGDIRKKRG
jgi:transposase